MKDDDSQVMENNIAEAIIEMPYAFKAEGQYFFIYPPSLGTTLLIQRLMSEIPDKDRLDGIWNIIKAVKTNRRLVNKMLALCSFSNRKDAIIEFYTESKSKEFEKASNSDCMNMVMVMSEWVNDLQKITEYIGLDKEQEYIEKVNAIKDRDNTTLMFNGKSMYGTLIDVACERYGWTFDYVVWGISLTNLKLLMADHITTMYMTKDEMKSVNIPMNKNVIGKDTLKGIKSADELIKML